MVYRRSGDDNLLVEYGPMALDFALRLRVHPLMQAVQQAEPAGHHRPHAGHSLAANPLRQHASVARAGCSTRCASSRRALPAVDAMTVPSRIVHLPLSWNDPQAAARDAQISGAGAPQRALVSVEYRIHPPHQWPRQTRTTVKRIVFDASYLVLGLGDVYLGAPVATPARSAPSAGDDQIQSGAHLDAGERRRHRRRLYVHLWHGRPGRLSAVRPHDPDVEHAGARTPVFEPGKPWLLRFFDQIRFFPVSAEELLEARAAFPHGAYPLKIEETEFSYADYAAFLARDRDIDCRLQERQQAAFEAERQRWKDLRIDEVPEPILEYAPRPAADDIPDGTTGASRRCRATSGRFWWRRRSVAPGDGLAIIESMKMEISVSARRRRPLVIDPHQARPNITRRATSWR